MAESLIKYGGAVTGLAEERAIIKSIRNSRKTGNWQQAGEGAKFERELADYTGVKYAILTNSGSSAGLLALSALELPLGSEVIISAVTFPTIFNIILQCGLVPVVVDAKIGTYVFDVEQVKRAVTENTKAIIAIHALGNPVDLVELKKLCQEKRIKLILDNCDGLATTLNQRKVETYADISFTSLHAAHIVSMGVGGAVFTNDKRLAKHVRMYRDWGRQADVNRSKNTKWKALPEDYNPRFIYEKIGYNFQILDLQAAMGRVQLRKIGKIKKLRQKNFNYLYKKLNKYPLIMPQWLEGAEVCWFAFPLSVVQSVSRGQLLRHLEKRGIETRPMFSGNILVHPAYTYQHYEGSLKDANFILEKSFWISCHPSLTQKQLDRIVKAFDDFFTRRHLDLSD